MSASRFWKLEYRAAQPSRSNCPLQRADELSNGSAVRASIGDNSRGPVWTVAFGRHADDTAAVNVRLLASKAWQNLDARDQHRFQLLGGASRLGHCQCDSGAVLMLSWLGSAHKKAAQKAALVFASRASTQVVLGFA